MKISRKQVGAIYAAMKAWKLEYNQDVITYLYDEVADKEVDEDTAKTIRYTLDSIFDKTGSPVWSMPYCNEMLAKLVA